LLWLFMNMIVIFLFTDYKDCLRASVTGVCGLIGTLVYQLSGVTNTRTGRHVVIEADCTKPNTPNNNYPHDSNYSDDYDSDENE